MPRDLPRPDATRPIRPRSLAFSERDHPQLLLLLLIPGICMGPWPLHGLPALRNFVPHRDFVKEMVQNQRLTQECEIRGSQRKEKEGIQNGLCKISKRKSQRGALEERKESLLRWALSEKTNLSAARQETTLSRCLCFVSLWPEEDRPCVCPIREKRTPSTTPPDSARIQP